MLSLGIDTSNYTTSVAIFDTCSGILQQRKQLLEVENGRIGLRQSDAVFLHTRNLPILIESLFEDISDHIDAVGASLRPVDSDSSYMPCFTVGSGAARSVAAMLKLKPHFFSHQQGHIASACFSSDKLSLLSERFIAFHVSGGTTEALLVVPDKEKIIKCTPIASSLDLKAGQAVDRVGSMLSLPFPSGPSLDTLACTCSENIRLRPVIRGRDCSLSGIENKCKELVNRGTDPAYVARYCIEFICASLEAVTEKIIKDFGELPLVFSGGVMSNSIIREKLSGKYGAYFADPVFSSDNASGTAILTSIEEGWCFQ